VRLRELDAKFIRYETRIATWTRVLGDPLVWKPGDPTEEVTGPQEWSIPVENLADAQGVFFQCPLCAEGKPRSSAAVIGAHYFGVTFADRGVLPHQGCHGTNGEPTRWQVTGTGLDDLTTQPSIQIQGGCNWHGYITDGAAA